MALGQNIKIEQELISETGPAILRLRGDIDAHTSRTLQKYIGELFAANCYKVIIDLSHVKYMSSAGASLLVVAQTEANENKGAIVLVRPSQSVKYVLDILGLTPILQMAEDRNNALALLSAQ
ncbi:MAG TPA: STAS domain-containing protein [Planctomycetota bacterium]